MTRVNFFRSSGGKASQQSPRVSFKHPRVRNSHLSTTALLDMHEEYIAMDEARTARTKRQ
jgi:hypothetical protein